MSFVEINLEETSVNTIVATFSSVEQEALGRVIDCRSYGSLNKIIKGYWVCLVVQSQYFSQT